MKQLEIMIIGLLKKLYHNFNAFVHFTFLLFYYLIRNLLRNRLDKLGQTSVKYLLEQFRIGKRKGVRKRKGVKYLFARYRPCLEQEG